MPIGVGGSIASPSITAIVKEKERDGNGHRSNETGNQVITTETYIKLDTVTTGCVLYFTTDGLSPDPFNRIINGIERTFKYKGPFKLRSGTRIVTVVAICRSSRKMSRYSKEIFEVLSSIDDTTSSISDLTSTTLNDLMSSDDHHPRMSSVWKRQKEDDRDDGRCSSVLSILRNPPDDTDSNSTATSDVYTDMTTPRRDVAHSLGKRVSDLDRYSQNEWFPTHDINRNYYSSGEYSPSSAQRVRFETDNTHSLTPNINFQSSRITPLFESNRQSFPVALMSSRSDAWDGPLVTDAWNDPNANGRQDERNISSCSVRKNIDNRKGRSEEEKRLLIYDCMDVDRAALLTDELFSQAGRMKDGSLRRNDGRMEKQRSLSSNSASSSSESEKKKNLKSKKTDEEKKEIGKSQKKKIEKENEKNVITPRKNGNRRIENGKVEMEGKEGVMNFRNDSGTQINFWGMNADDMMKTVSSFLPQKGHEPHPLPPSPDLFRSVDGKPASGKSTSHAFSSSLSTVGRFQNSMLSPVTKVQQEEQQAIALPSKSSLRKFFKGWKTPEKSTEGPGTPVNQLNGKPIKKPGYAEIHAEFLEKETQWMDPEFPADEQSLCHEDLELMKRIVWKRPTEFCESPQLTVDGATRFDVVQGVLGDCWLLAAVASLTADPEILQKVVPFNQSFQTDYAGIFRFCIWQYGSWCEVIIDDRLPTINDKLVYLHSPEKNEFWSALLEKAYAKLCGSYAALTGGLASEAMTDFTGGIVERFDFHEETPENMFQILVKANERSSLMSCAIDSAEAKMEEKLDSGLIVGHAYSITDVRVVLETAGSKVELLRVRNPWGNDCEWKGAWSDESEEWNKLTDDEKKDLGLNIAHDGEFWMDFEDFKTHFNRVEICHLGPDDMLKKNDKLTWECSIQDGSWKNKVNAGGCRNYMDTFWVNPQYRIDVADADDDDEDDLGTVIIGIMQMGTRKRKDQGLNPLTIGYDIYPVPESDANQNTTTTLTKEYLQSTIPIATAPAYSDLREVCGRHRLKPGEYVVMPTTFEPNEEADYIVRIFTEKKHRISEVDQSTCIIQPKTSPSASLLEAGKEEDTMTEAEDEFKRNAEENGTIDAYDLQKILNEVFTKGFDSCQFDINLCRSLLAMRDVDHSGKLDLAEFKHVWNDLQSWKSVFLEYDRNDDYFFNSFEFREALKSVGYQVSNATFSMIVVRYSNRKGEVHFDDFVAAIVKLKTMFDIFQSQLHPQGNSANFSLDEFIQMTIYS